MCRNTRKFWEFETFFGIFEEITVFNHLKNASKNKEILGIRGIFRHFRRNYLYIKNHIYNQMT